MPYLAISASICLIAALIEAWLLVVVFSRENGPLNRLLPNGNEPPRICRRLQLLRDWGHGNEEDCEELFT